MSAPVLPPGTTVYRRDPSGSITMAVLPATTEIEGIPCLPGPVVHFHPNGALAQCDLARDAVVQGIHFGTGTTLQLDERGHLETAWPIGAVTIAGRVYPDGSALTFDPDGSVTEWHHEGETRDATDRLIRKVLKHEQTLDGLPCAAGPVEFHPSGRLATATLASDRTLGALSLPAGSTFSLDEGGVLTSARAPVPLTLAGKEYPAGAMLQLAPDGTVAGYATISVTSVACPVAQPEKL
jgi:hypothetical protein